MNQVNILLACDTRLLGEVLRHGLRQHADFQVYESRGRSPLDVLLEVERTCADAVVVEANEEDGVPGICSHLFMEFPQITVIVLSRRGSQASVLRQEVRDRPLDDLSTRTLVEALSGANVGYWGS